MLKIAQRKKVQIEKCSKKESKKNVQKRFRFLKSFTRVKWFGFK
jgi:hypothetical protein